MALTDHEKVRIRHHMGYLNVGSVQTFSLGVPSAVETQFLIDGAMNRILPEAETEVRRLVSILDQIEAQQVNDLELLATSKVGEIEVNETEQAKLKVTYRHWQQSLGNLLGVPPNPHDMRFRNSGVNVAVAGD